MKLLGTALIVMGMLALGDATEGDKDKKSAPKFTIGKDTTYVTGPLDKDGYIDYEAAVNDHLSKGVTPATNALVLIVQAIGPRPEGAKMLPEFYRRLGIQEPPERGDYFVSLGNHLKEQLKIAPGKETEEILNQWTRAAQRPWAAKDHKILAGWLQVNQKPIALIIEATKRPAYYNPLVTRHTENGPGGLFSALLSTIQKCREVATFLAARAMLRTHEGKLDEAWQDLLACHRLGRLVARGGTLIEGLVGFAIDQVANNADLAFLERARLTSKKALDCLLDLQRLPAMPTILDKVAVCERLAFLETVMLLDRHGLRYLEGLSGGTLPKDLDPKVNRALHGADWDPALETGNRWFNRMAAALGASVRADRVKQLNQFEEEVKELKKRIDKNALNEVFQGSKPPDKAATKMIGEVLVTLLLPAVGKVQQATDRTVQAQRNLHIAFALAAYHGDHGRYPRALEALAPKYLKQVPDDLFSDKALIYHPTDNGYLLYSVGPNGKDDGGRGREDNPPGDDLPVRMPLPELKQK